MAEKEYIDRAAFRQELIDRQITTQFFNPIARNEIGCIVEMLDNAPAADVVDVVHSAWVWAEEGEADYDKYWVCPICGEKSYIHHNYCPNCGAKMDIGEAT